VPGAPFDPSSLSPEIRTAIEAGMADAWQEFGEFRKEQIDTLKVTSGQLFGTREFLQNDYLKRMAGAVLGIYGNSREEAMYPSYFVDGARKPLDGSQGGYRLRFAPGQLPPVDAFWSLTLYQLPQSLLYANPINRYLINSPMLDSLKRDADGGITIDVQHASPGAGRESNWLPAPNGPFWLVLRLYRPRAEAIDGGWTQPPLRAVNDPVSGAAAGGAASSASGSGTSKTASAIAAEGLQTVTPTTYIRAETDRNFRNVAALSGGRVNTFHHFRAPTPLDKQTVVRMNKDTLYSLAIVDTAGGATLTLPQPDKGRYMSALLVDNDHYAPQVIYTPGTHPLPSDTKYLGVAIRIQVFNPDDPDELALVNRLQDQIVINARSADPFPPSRWEPESLARLTKQYEEESRRYPNYNGMMGPRGSVNETERHIAAAAAFGLFPEKDAIYLNYAVGHSASVCHTATYRVPENGAFWSITIYGSDGYMKSANAILNSSNVKLNPDGTFTAYFGSMGACGAVPNRLDVSEGWNFLMRIYRPGPSVLDGSYTLPKAQPIAAR
jgi:hypothetical protein